MTSGLEASVGRLGWCAVQRGHLTSIDLETCLLLQRELSEVDAATPLGRLLVDQGHLRESELLELIALQMAWRRLVGAATLNLLYGQALSFDVRVRVPTLVMAASLLAVPLVDLAMRAGLASRGGGAQLRLLVVNLASYPVRLLLLDRAGEEQPAEARVRDG